jgi:hypothetical protein
VASIWIAGSRNRGGCLMATVLSPGDLAIVQYNSSTTDSFTFVFARDVEAGTVVNFTDNGWLAAGGFRPGESTVSYTAPTAITAGTVVTLTGLNLDDAGDQIIAYQGTQASPTILYLVDLADGNNTVAGNATNDNTTALPPGLTLGQNAVAVGFDNAIYAGPIDGSPPSCSPSSATRPTGSLATHCPRRPVISTRRTSISIPTIRRPGASTIGQRSPTTVPRSPSPTPTRT